MQASETCLNAIKEWEGCHLSIYSDLNGFPTIGYGHKITYQEAVSNVFAQGISQARADVLFGADIVPFERQIDGLKLDLKQGQYDALVSFTYNLGLNSLMHMLSHGLDQVPEQLPRWVHAAGIVQPGLEIRRKTELAWWLS